MICFIIYFGIKVILNMTNIKPLKADCGLWYASFRESFIIPIHNKMVQTDLFPNSALGFLYEIISWKYGKCGRIAEESFKSWVEPVQ